MRIEHRLTLTITVSFLLLFSVCSNIPVSAINSIEWPDWSLIDPIVIDTIGDEEDDYDITECYCVCDNEYFYFKINVIGSIIKSSTYVLLDTDRNPITGDNGLSVNSIDHDGELSQHGIGADYMLDPVDVADLYQWDPGWSRVNGIDFRIQDGSIELAVLRSDIGNPSMINILFLTNLPDTDYAPNRGYVTCPEQPTVPVGGLIEPVNILNSFVLQSAVLLTFFLILGVLALKKR